MKIPFNIFDKSLLYKVVDFIYVYSIHEKVSSKDLLSIILDKQEVSSWEIVQKHVEIDKLRIVSKKHKVGDSPTIEELDQQIDLFLVHLCSESEEVSLFLDNLLEEIIGMGEQGFHLQCVNRLVGILSAMVLVYCRSNDSCENKLSQDMRDIFIHDLYSCISKDKDFLMSIFWQYDEQDCLLVLLKTLISGLNEERTEKEFVDAFVNLCGLYYKKRRSHTYKEKTKHGEIFIRRCEELFDLCPNYKVIWYIELANNLLSQHKYEEAKEIWEECVRRGNSGPFMIYNRSVFYAWLAEKKEKYGVEWKNYIAKTLDCINEGITLLTELDDSEIICQYRLRFYVEKAFILAELENYDEAYDWLKKAKGIYCAGIPTEYSNYNTFFWIVLQYLKRHPNKRGTTIPQIIESSSNRFAHFPTDYYKIFEFVLKDSFLKDNNDFQNSICECLLFALLDAQEIMHISKIRDPEQYDIVYYTKLNNLKLLLEDEEDTVKYRMPLFHAYHMNDPQEGRVLYDYLSLDETSSKTDRKIVYEENYVFLKSFFLYPKKNGNSYLKEFLPMWVQYGDEAKGCCVVLNSKTFEESTLRKITYLSDEWRCDDEKMNVLLKDFRGFYSETFKICRKIELLTENNPSAKNCIFKIQSILKYIVSQIAYLFKCDSYKHENEVRLIKTLSEYDLSKAKSVSGDIPKVYVYSDIQTFIDEIILGSKVENPEDYIPFFYIQGRKMWKEQSKTRIKISHSVIQYR